LKLLKGILALDLRIASRYYRTIDPLALDRPTWRNFADDGQAEQRILSCLRR
jgi:hypothetical protein